jgi:hypothetical protein
MGHMLSSMVITSPANTHVLVVECFDCKTAILADPCRWVVPILPLLLIMSFSLWLLVVPHTWLFPLFVRISALASPIQ